MKRLVALLFGIIITNIFLFAPIRVGAEVWCKYTGGGGGEVVQKFPNEEQCTRAGGQVVDSAEEGLQQARTENSTNNPGVFANAMYKVVARIANIILSIAALLTTLSGYLLNGVVYHTIVNVSENYNNLKPIEEAWRVIRDISNMAFIFVLLYAGIRTIFGVGEDNQKVVKNVVLAAILINFSMFFTRVVIDISNVFALTFYDAIAPGVAAKGFELGQAGLSNAFSQYLSYQTLYQMAGNIDLNGIITTAIMGTIMLIIVSFVFFAIAIMFIIRYVVLLLVIILSPIYFISLALPKGTGIGAYSQQWLNALIGQAFFAPIYFLMTWVAVRVMGGIMTALQVPGATGAEATGSALSGLSIGGTLSSGAFMMFINFAIVITLIITALMVAKDWANKVGGGFNKVTSWATGKAGDFTMGVAGKATRSTIGRAGQAISDNQWLRERAPESRLARLALAAGKKTGSSSFDMRNASFASQFGAGKASGEGGYQGDRNRTIKRRMDELDKLSDTVTGQDVENAMNTRRWTTPKEAAYLQSLGLSQSQIAGIQSGGLGKDQMDRLGITAAQAERLRTRMQRELVTAAAENTAIRKDRFLHHLSQQRWYTTNAFYNSVDSDAEAARRMRGSSKKKGNKKRDDDYWEENDDKKKDGDGDKGDQNNTNSGAGNPNPNNSGGSGRGSGGGQNNNQQSQGGSRQNQNSGSTGGSRSQGSSTGPRNTGPRPSGSSPGNQSSGSGTSNRQSGGNTNQNNNRNSGTNSANQSPNSQANNPSSTSQGSRPNTGSGSTNSGTNSSNPGSGPNTSSNRSSSNNSGAGQNNSSNQAGGQGSGSANTGGGSQNSSNTNNQGSSGGSGGQAGPKTSPPPAKKSFYERLGVTKNATADEITAAYRKMRRDRNNHPDAFPDDPVQKAAAEERAKDMNEAYQTLNDPILKSRYDRDN